MEYIRNKGERLWKLEYESKLSVQIRGDRTALVLNGVDLMYVSNRDGTMEIDFNVDFLKEEKHEITLPDCSTLTHK